MENEFRNQSLRNVLASLTANGIQVPGRKSALGVEVEQSKPLTLWPKSDVSSSTEPSLSGLDLTPSLHVEIAMWFSKQSILRHGVSC